MSIHEHLPPQARRELKEVGSTKGLVLAILLNSISRYYKFSPGEQQQTFLENLLEKAS